jgi:hypothetical protein
MTPKERSGQRINRAVVCDFVRANLGNRLTRRLWLLLIAHMIAGVGFCVSARVLLRLPFPLNEILSAPTLSLAFCQSCLLAFWVEMSHTALWRRLLGLGGGLSYFWLLTATWRQDFTLFFALAFTTGIVMVALFVVRFWRIDLRRATDQSTHQNRQGLQFSIRGLMLLTIAVGLLITPAKGLRQMILYSDYGQTTFLLMLSASLAATGLASFWATLGLPRPVARSIALIVMSLCLGWFLCYVYSASTWSEYFLILSIMFLHSLALLGSLLVIRSCGYRLVKRDRNAVAAVSS